MDLNELKRLVTEGNKELPKLGLVKFSWGNVSAIDREKGIIVIKPVGMPYAQLHRPLPCFGTTHADYFAGEIPCTEPLTEAEIADDYEWNTGMAIVRCFERRGISPKDVPGALSIDHGPFTWGGDVWDAVHKAAVLEELCKMAVHMLAISPDIGAIPEAMSRKHFYRKHGPNAYFTNDDYGHGKIKRG